MATTSSPREASATPMLSSSSIDSSFAGQYWRASQDEAKFALLSSLALCLAAGNLNVETFERFVSQDNHILKTFSSLLQSAAEYADDDDSRISISKLRMDIEKISVKRKSFLKVSTVAKDIALDPATARYTDFLLKTASGKVEGIKDPGKFGIPYEKTKLAAYILGIIAPSMRLSAFLAMELKGSYDPNIDDNRYKDWIDYHSSVSFQEPAQQTEGLLDELSATLTSEELTVLKNLYHHSLKLQIDFLFAQGISQPSVFPVINAVNSAEDRLLFFSAFDRTCTTNDSSATLAEIAITLTPKSGVLFSSISSPKMKEMWQIIQDQYADDYGECLQHVLQENTDEKFNHELLVQSIEPISEFEKVANTRVIDSGLLWGLKLQDIKHFGEHSDLRPGCMNFFQELVNNNKMEVNIHVLSYCWCADMIRSSFASGEVDNVKIHANELVFDKRSICNGQMVRNIETPADKVKLFQNILESTNSDKKNLTVYIGDDVGDLLCLLEADIGIIINCSSGLERIGLKFGISFVPLFQGLIKKQRELRDESTFCSGKKSGVLYTVSSWAEIHAYILGRSV